MVIISGVPIFRIFTVMTESFVRVSRNQGSVREMEIR